MLQSSVHLHVAYLREIKLQIIPEMYWATIFQKVGHFINVNILNVDMLISHRNMRGKLAKCDKKITDAGKFD